MDDTIIDNWNNVVKTHDVVYVLGDFILANRKYTEEILDKLNGHIHLCVGDHDSSILKYADIRNRMSGIDKNMRIKVSGQEIFLAHYCHKVWAKSHYGTWHLFSHSHGGLDHYTHGEGKLLDVGVDNNYFFPLTFDQVKDIMDKRPLNFNDLRRKRRHP